MERPVAGFETCDHAADLRLRAWGSNVDETFLQACLGLWNLVVDVSSVPDERAWEVAATGADLEELLVNILNEQIYFLDADGLVAGKVLDLRVDEVPGKGFAARVRLSGTTADRLGTPLWRHLKAATYHNVKAEPNLVEVTIDI